MKRDKFKTVEMTRRIRDAHYEELKGKSPQEQIRFYRSKANSVQSLKSLSRR